MSWKAKFSRLATWVRLPPAARAALVSRAEAAEAFNDAVARKDTRDQSRALQPLIDATTRQLRAEMGRPA